MFHFATSTLEHLLTTYGYWAVLLFVAIESTGIPFPGETMLLIAAIYAGTTHHLSIPWIIVVAASGAILGDNLGFWIGREGGFRLLRRYGRSIRLNERKLKLGLYLFRKHGGKVVFFGRFIAVLRAWAAFLAGTNRMPWPAFLLFNALGGIMWATIYGLGGYFLGILFTDWQGQLAPSRSSWPPSSFSRDWYSCGTTSDSWRRKQRKPYLGPWKATELVRVRGSNKKKMTIWICA